MNSCRFLPEWLDENERDVISGAANQTGWVSGRQGGGYQKLDIIDNIAFSQFVDRAVLELGSPDRYDAFLLRYPTGSSIQPHTDEAEDGMCHVRLNAVVVSGEGGELYLDGNQCELGEGEAYVFRPDNVVHAVGKIVCGQRLMLSVGANISPEQAEAIA